MSFTHDLAISAVSYDVLLVSDLSTRLAASLGSAPLWRGGASHGARAHAASYAPALLHNGARVAVVLHQRLWGRDETTQADALALRQRAKRDARSIRVVTLDAEPVPAWLADAPHRSLGTAGLDGVTHFLLDAVTACGGAVLPTVSSGPPAAPWSWTDSNRPYLTQSRAVTALRREFEALGECFEPFVRSPKFPDERPIVALHCAPNRITAQLESVGLSFSWLPGRDGTVADGRLMIIEWEGTITSKPGMGAIRTGTPVRERSYCAESSGPGTWRWRADDAEGARYSTADLAAQWLAGATLADGVPAAHTP